MNKEEQEQLLQDISDFGQETDAMLEGDAKYYMDERTKRNCLEQNVVYNDKFFYGVVDADPPKVKVYAFMFNDNNCESADEIQSLHRTKKGAYKAMNKYLNERENNFQERRRLFGKRRKGDNFFSKWENWNIKEFELED